ncbi:MAG: COX15/CtaA family protein [Hyphomicrobiaceae bacterium]
MSTAALASDPARPDGSPALVRLWLVVVALLVLAMIVVGGATRLTDSGLSITEWQPLLGAIPPLSDANWQEAFAKYKQIPEYREVNRGMSLDAFKVIFWWEWGHRFLGRIIGVVFAVPLLAFWLTGRIPRGFGLPLTGLLLLGGLQGAIGWYMVQSGLTEGVDVSPYRLALHLSMAILILGLIVWTILGLSPPDTRVILLDTVTPAQRRGATVLLALVFLQIVAGAFVAGHKAGLVYNTWPTMNGEVLPDGLLLLTPWWLNAFENITTIQFNHRLLAYVLVLLALRHAWSVTRSADARTPGATAMLLAAGLVAQAALGIVTLLAVSEARIPVVLGVAHQGGAAVVFMLAVWHRHAIGRR